MKVLMLAPDSQVVDRRIVQEAKTLAGAGHAVTVLCGFTCARDEVVNVDGVTVRRFAYVPRRPLVQKVGSRVGGGSWRLPRLQELVLAAGRRLFRLTPFEKFVVEKAAGFDADVVHGHDLPMLRPALELKSRRGAAVVYDAHELYAAQEALSPAQRRRCFVEEHESIGRADAVITVNDLIARRLAELHGVAEPVVIRNSVDPPPRELVRARGGPLRQAFGPRDRIVLFQGWISAERNLDTLVRAMARLEDDVRLAIIGYGDHEPVLRRLVAEHGLHERVRFFGRVPQEELAAHTVGADLGVIPYLPIDENHRLCSPNKLFEFVVCGVPVLAHDLPFLRLVAERHGVVHCGDLSSPERAAAAIRTALEPRRLATMRERCLQEAPRFSWREDARVLLDVYDRLDRGPVRGRR